MTKEIRTGAAPVSKYAAKRNARVKANASEEVKVPENSNVVGTEVAEVVVENKINSTKLSYTRKPKIKGISPAAHNYPEHIVAIALIIKNNAEIRRFTALGILNYLLQTGEIKGESRYVSFKWNKFAVKCNGLMREYSYTEPFFINALVAAFTSFSASAQRTIDTFCKVEMSVSISKAVSKEEVENIATLNEEYQNSNVVVEDSDEE